MLLAEAIGQTCELFCKGSARDWGNTTELIWPDVYSYARFRSAEAVTRLDVTGRNLMASINKVSAEAGQSGRKDSFKMSVGINR